MTTLIEALHAIDTWDAGHAATAVVDADGVVGQHGDADRVFRWASVTKPVTVGMVRTTVTWDDGPPWTSSGG